MSGARRRVPGRPAGGSNDTAFVVVAGIGFATLLVVWAAWAGGTALTGGTVSWNPPGALIEVAAGRRSWPVAATVLLVAIVILGATAITVGAIAWSRRRPTRHAIDRQARLMAPPSRLQGVTAKAADTIGARVFAADAAPHADKDWRRGIRLGNSVVGDIGMYAGWQNVLAMVGGTGSGKTTAFAVPTVLDAPGPVLATSNGPDIWAHTHTEREARGRVWLCDLQGVTGHARTEFWVDLLTQARHGVADARTLAANIVAASKVEPNARVDAYFDGGAQELLALYLLAAGVGDGDLLHTLSWLGRDQDETPILLLAWGGEIYAAQRIREAQQITPRQRDGLYDMARRYLGVLAERRFHDLVTPNRRVRFTVSGDVERALDRDPAAVHIETTRAATGHELPRFDPQEFVTSSDTLYLLSRKGAGSTAPLTSALVGGVLETAIKTAMAQPSAVLPVPLPLVLDEAANICPMPNLPDMYSWLRKHAILPMVFLQSPSQGVEAWGENGLKAILSQSIHIYGGNVDDPDYLEHWAALTGAADMAHVSHSTGHGGADLFGGSGRSRSVSWQTEPIFRTSDLAEMPLDRALVRFPGNPPVLIRKRHFFTEKRPAPKQRVLVAASTDSRADRFTDTTSPTASYDRFAVPATRSRTDDAGWVSGWDDHRGGTEEVREL